ncbi:SemiSWEET transporter [Ekhidna sp.]|uniref:SemiSWEET transporter n=1 Tax=Ekhidna sp. TaxID=2608089 RepID=UPI003C7EA968
MNYIGFIAAFLTTISFAPQAIKTIRTKSTESLSLGMYLTFNTGVGCWLAYGIHLGDLPIIIANSITLLLTGTILILKLKHG